MTYQVVVKHHFLNGVRFLSKRVEGCLSKRVEEYWIRKTEKCWGEVVLQ